MAILISPLALCWQSRALVCKAEKDGAGDGAEGERHSLFPANHRGREGATSRAPWRKVVTARERRDIANPRRRPQSLDRLLSRAFRYFPDPVV